MESDERRLNSAEIIDLLKHEFPSLKDKLTVTEEAGGTRIRLPRAQSAEYIFQVWIYPDPPATGMDVSAELPEAKSHVFFWNHSYESMDFKSDKEMLKAILKLLHEILESDSRILQRRGLLFWNFRVEINVDSKWCPLQAGASIFRWSNMTVPNSEMKLSVYQSARVIRPVLPAEHM